MSPTVSENKEFLPLVLFQGLDSEHPNAASPISPSTSTMSAPLSSLPPPVVKRRNKMGGDETKAQYRCSLINLENSQDEELDAILGELSILESQFDDELSGKLGEGDDGTLKRQQQSTGSDGAVAAQAIPAAAASAPGCCPGGRRYRCTAIDQSRETLHGGPALLVEHFIGWGRFWTKTYGIYKCSYFSQITFHVPK